MDFFGTNSLFFGQMHVRYSYSKKQKGAARQQTTADKETAGSGNELGSGFGPWLILTAFIVTFNCTVSAL